MKEGYKTTEFWVAIGMIVASMFLIYQGNIKEGVALLTVSAGTYKISRGLAKGGNGNGNGG